ncbi:tetratricopeptide repeat protein [Acidicapsa dinghuensis]|uniref:Tetratricopeptide repeat protein n=1 Tax=Acidicapsa dinghuensis TaxID=2218256 RepID=A0ABW1EM99_9BACT|nr:tetratricopeptide repeat protein [Acidicapsa dinghuensis]
MARRSLWLSAQCRSFLLVLVGFVSFTAAAQQSGDAYRQSVLAIQQQIDAGDLEGARSAVVQAEKQYPNNGGLENLLGVIEAQHGHLTAARQAFLAAVRHDPRLVGAYMNLSRLDMQTAAKDATARAEALRMSERVVQMDTANDEAHYQIATILAWEKNYARSLAELERLSPQAQTAIGAQALICEDHAALGHREATDRAAHMLASNTDLTEEDANPCVSALRAAHRAVLIEELLSSAAERHPLSPAGLRMLGLAQEADGKLGQARATLEKAFTADSTSVEILIDLTRVAKAAGDNQGALGYLAHARDLRPTDATLPYEFGVICLRMGLYAEARKAIGAALEIEPDNPDYNHGMGLVVSFSEDPGQAMPYLLKYHTLRPQDPNGLLALGDASFRAKDYDTALTWLRQAVVHPATAAEAHYYLGRIARLQGNISEATGELKDSLQLLPNQASVLAELGQIAVSKGDNTEASTYLDRAVKLDPDNYAGNYGLLLLYARTRDPRLEQQSKRFDEVKNKKDERDVEMMRSLEISRDGKPNSSKSQQKPNQ